MCLKLGSLGFIYLMSFGPLALQFQTFYLNPLCLDYFAILYFDFWTCLKRRVHIMTITMKLWSWRTLEVFFFACDGLAYMMLSCGSQPRLVSQGKKYFNSLLSAFNPFLFNHALRQKKIFNRGPEDFSFNSSLQAGCLFWGTVT